MNEYKEAISLKYAVEKFQDIFKDAEDRIKTLRFGFSSTKIP